MGEFFAKSVVNRGNLHRLKQCMRNAEQGGSLTVGFLGGSITQGCAATDDARCYAWLTCDWWRRRFPQADIRYVNSGIGGTSSLFGVGRAWPDMIQKRPDVVFVDFSVNDEPNAFFQETFEGLVRQLYGSSGHPAMVVLNNVFYDTGKSAQDWHNAVAAHYGLPSVSMRESLYASILAGDCRLEDITADGLHPNDRGHREVAGQLTAFLEQVYQERNTVEPEMGFPPPLTDNAWENAVRYQNWNSAPVLDGFLADRRPKEGYQDHFKQGWTGSRAGDRIQFLITCQNIAVQYRRTAAASASKARVTVDGEETGAMLLDGSFDEDWGDCLYLQPLLVHGERREHRITLEIAEEAGEGGAPFYLMSLICA